MLRVRSKKKSNLIAIWEIRKRKKQRPFKLKKKMKIFLL